MISFPAPLTARMPASVPHDRVPRAAPIPRARIARHYRAVFLSDLHLGARACRIDMLLDFLHAVTADRVYLVGDVFDLCRYRPPFWTPVHDQVLDALSHMNVTRLPGNHDRHIPSSIAMGPESVTHRTANGQRYLVVHGDCAESRLGRSTIVARMGSYLDCRAQALDQVMPSLSGRAHRTIRWGDTLISRNTTIRTRLTKLARAGQYDGIICGHLHQPALIHENGMTYANCGDWTTSLTAVAEDEGGAMSLIDWRTRTETRLTVGFALA